MKLFNKSALALILLSPVTSIKPTEMLLDHQGIIAKITQAKASIAAATDNIAADVTLANSAVAAVAGFASNVTGQTNNERIRRNLYALAFLIPTTIVIQKLASSELPASTKTIQSVSPYCVAAAYALGAILGRTVNYVGRITKPHIVSASKYVGNKALDVKNYIASKFHNN